MEGKVRIDWDYSGKKDFTVGTGAHNTEKILGWAACFVLPILIIYQFIAKQLHWNYLQLSVALIIGFDIGGGMICNSLNSCKRFYHSPPKENEGKLGKILKNNLLFGSFHIHPIIVSLIYGNGNLLYGIIWYEVFMLSIYIVYKTPLYLKRPVAMLIILIATIANFYFLTPVKSFEWLIPFLFIKIIYGHLVREEPYRPTDLISG